MVLCWDGGREDEEAFVQVKKLAENAWTSEIAALINAQGVLGV